MKSQVGKKVENKSKKVFVGMSGGVDSSVSAALLQEAGYNVTGVFIKVWQPDWLPCTAREDRIDAMRVALDLNIPFITLDLEKEYKKEVVDYMIEEYKAGRTPNPDIMCNSHVKFGAFYNWAMENGADYVATGHYAQIDNGNLKMGNDKNKDQSYFLWTLKKDQMNHILFPVGNLEKPEVRKIAKRLKLYTAEKKDSQGICFIGKIDIKDFLSHYIIPKKGNVLDINGNIIGYHSGSFLYTIGERHGFIITEKTPNDLPYYIISKDIDKNTITVSNKNDMDEIVNGKKEIILKNINWINKKPKFGISLEARSRYRQILDKIKVKDESTIEFERPQYTLSSGQSLVIYDGDICVGGGIIV